MILSKQFIFQISKHDCLVKVFLNVIIHINSSSNGSFSFLKPIKTLSAMLKGLKKKIYQFSAINS